MFVNGYDISQNEAERGRLYRLRNAAGKVVREALSIGHAIEVARRLPAGDVPDPDRPPAPELAIQKPTPELPKVGDTLPTRWPPKDETAPEPEPPPTELEQPPTIAAVTPALSPQQPKITRPEPPPNVEVRDGNPKAMPQKKSAKRTTAKHKGSK